MQFNIIDITYVFVISVSTINPPIQLGLEGHPSASSLLHSLIPLNPINTRINKYDIIDQDITSCIAIPSTTAYLGQLLTTITAPDDGIAAQINLELVGENLKCTDAHVKVLKPHSLNHYKKCYCSDFHAVEDYLVTCSFGCHCPMNSDLSYILQIKDVPDPGEEETLQWTLCKLNYNFI